MSASELLQHLIRIHDEQPDEAAEQLPGLVKAADLPTADRPKLAWLVNHMLGEKRGDWRGAWTLLDKLPLEDANQTLLRHCFVAATLAGDALAVWRLERQWRSAGAQDAEIHLLVRMGVLQSLCGTVRLSSLLPILAETLDLLDDGTASGHDATLAMLFNNIVSTLLEREDLETGNAVCWAVIWRAANAARSFWGRAGNWVNHERAEYLLALTANRFQRWPAGLAAADEGLGLIAANGEEAVDQAFLLLERARAMFGLGRDEGGMAAYEAAQALAASFGSSLRPWFDGCARRAKKKPALAGL
ncbi:hypothetical protein [Chromobacterium alticapitis]|uniref:Uncharacterized protein n=1 Tax=Chromobacterium alticapitis TaxID=2073169 RepID=A0A2S5DK76_9NEIS|nr:hypothetical protein [Chromobacterium alticapitis]POZ63402.1 hypothetical protein C2I19_03365 [Chromobacterium alticapitis]